MNLSFANKFLFAAVYLSASVGAKKDIRGTKSQKSDRQDHRASSTSYEIWAADQSNSVSGEAGKGAKGSFLWIWDSPSMMDYLDSSSPDQGAKPLSCTPNNEFGPCDLLDIFPSTLERCNSEDWCMGETLEGMPGFGRLHGVLADPSGRYVTANIFAPSGGYVGVIDTHTKEAVGLFRVTEVEINGKGGRSVHLSTWTADGSAILVANLHAKLIERIDVVRNEDRIITELNFNVGAGVFLGKDWNLLQEASYFSGTNAFGNAMVGSIVGTYDDTDTGDVTPTGACKESECKGGDDILGGGRPNNVPITPVPTTNSHAYITLGGGGLLVLKTDTTPMQIIGEYGKSIVNGAGVVGHQVGDKVFIESGVSASGAGFDQSTFSLYVFDDTLFSAGPSALQNIPAPIQAFKDPGNTNTGGNVESKMDNDDSGQLPQSSTRRDAHGLWPTIDGKYVHINDRIRNVIEVFDAETYKHVNTYDLVSADGKSGRSGPSGPCRAVSVTDDSNLVLNDPAPDLMEISPDGKYFIMAFRGPAPVTVAHAAQGSCPGVGIVEITENGKSGRLVGVLRTSNTVDNAPAGSMVGGHGYIGAERSDPHYAITVPKW
mmetsp:Transcript_14355/g.21571  ORF Transcript_14355/g.21571 Transcript_14355/m.21571 type:complete len:601 (-) Transcript_14355:144-1946(-)